MSYAQQLLEEGRAEGWAKGRTQGREEGRAEGRSQGREEGRAEGRSEGRSEGTQQGKVEAAEGLLRVGVTWDVIEAALGLNETAFRALKKRLSASNRSQTE